MNMNKERAMNELIGLIQHSFIENRIPDHRHERKVAKAYLLAGRFSLIVGGNVRSFEPKVARLGVGVYQLTAKAV